MKNNYNITLESDTNHSHYAKSSNHECTDLGSAHSLEKAIERAREKAMDYAEYKGTQVVNVTSDEGLVYTIGCGMKKGKRL